VADNIRRELVFNTGGRPYNNRDFETIQTALNDIKSLFEGFVNKNSNADSSVFNKSAWVIKWYPSGGTPLYPGESALVWLDGEFRFIEDTYYPGGYVSPYYIIPDDATESRLYKDGDVKPVFNLYSAKWITDAEFNQLNPTPTEYMKFTCNDDMTNALFSNSTFINSIRVLSTDNGTIYHNLTNEVTFEGEAGFSVYKSANNVIKFKQFSTDTTLPNANAVVITTSSKTLTTSSITSTELSYLDNVTSNIQTQLDNKLSTVTTNDIADDAVTSAKLANDITIDGNLKVKGTIKCANDIIGFDSSVYAYSPPSSSPQTNINYSWQNLTGFTNEYESDPLNPAKFRIAYDGTVYFTGTVKRKSGTIKSGEIWAVLPDDLNPITQTNIRFNISSVELDEFIYCSLYFDGTNFNADVKILGKQINENANSITTFYLDGITYNKLI